MIDNQIFNSQYSDKELAVRLALRKFIGRRKLSDGSGEPQNIRQARNRIIESETADELLRLIDPK